mgnify:CR=1 FL=1
MKAIIRYVEKYQLLYWLLLVLLLAVTLIRFLTINVGFCTAWDEAYFLIKLKEAYEGSFITGKSQWNLLAIHWFPYLNLTNPIHSRIAIYLCELIGAVIATFTCSHVFEKRDILKYFTLSYLLFLQVDTTYAGESLNYVPMQALLLSSALCGVVLYWHSIRPTRIIWMIPTGFALGMAFFVIMPSSILLIGAIGLLLLLKKDWKAVLSLVGGILLTLLYVHFFVCDLSQIYDAMQFTATYFTKSGYRYSPFDMIVQLGLLARDELLCMLICTAIYYLSKLIASYRPSLATIFMVTSLLIYYHYQVSPQTSISLIICSFILVLLVENVHYSEWGGVKTNYCYSALILLFPLIASIGTNTYIGGRMIGFSIAWLFLLFENKRIYKQYIGRLPFIEIVCVILLLHIFSPAVNKIHAKTDNYFTQGNPAFAQLSLTDDQLNYLNNVTDIMNEHNYKKDSSIVFTTEYDWATVYAIDAKLSSNFYQKRNFLFFPKDKMLKPDFVFMCAWDKMEIGDALHEMPWGWPQEFDSVFVGSPEGKDFPWDADRWLYYRKQN